MFSLTSNMICVFIQAIYASAVSIFQIEKVMCRILGVEHVFIFLSSFPFFQKWLFCSVLPEIIPQQRILT